MRESSKYNIRYLGFESLADGARRLDYAITAQSVAPRSASIHVPAWAFNGTPRVTFQDSSTICYEKLRRELETQAERPGPWAITLTPEDVEEFRPRRRAASKKP